MTTPRKVMPGQIYRDRDKRMTNRRLVVVSVENPHGDETAVMASYPLDLVPHVRIKTRRLRSYRFELLHLSRDHENRPEVVDEGDCLHSPMECEELHGACEDNDA